MPDHGLSPHQIHILQDVLAPYAQVITRVGLFGSRAIGTARTNSDIDLVLYGPVSEAVVDRLHSLFDESGLAVTVDLLAYDRIDTPPLKSHIDQVMQPLFEQAELQSAKKDA